MFFVVTLEKPLMDIIVNSEQISEVQPVDGGAKSVLYMNRGAVLPVLMSTKDIWSKLKPQEITGQLQQLQEIYSPVVTEESLQVLTTPTVSKTEKPKKVAWNKGMKGSTIPKSKPPVIEPEKDIEFTFES